MNIYQTYNTSLRTYFKKQFSVLSLSKFSFIDFYSFIYLYSACLSQKVPILHLLDEKLSEYLRDYVLPILSIFSPVESK